MPDAPRSGRVAPPPFLESWCMQPDSCYIGQILSALACQHDSCHTLLRSRLWENCSEQTAFEVFANKYPMTSDLAMKVGLSTAHVFKNLHRKAKIIIGKDTRLSGYMIETAITSGICSMGVDVLLVGPSAPPPESRSSPAACAPMPA